VVALGGADRWDGPGLDAWEPWTPAEVAARLEPLDVDWCVVGGWAIDLFLGGQHRSHHDLEIATQRSHLATIRQHLEGFTFHAVGRGSVVRLAPDEVSPLACRQHWVLDDGADAWRLDVMIEPGDASWWIYRRDERVRAPRADMVARTAGGIPYLLPHGALLYKAKDPAAKDLADFEVVLPHMNRKATSWPADTLSVVHPGHPWLEVLT
jgi:hypothetical protein